MTPDPISGECPPSLIARVGRREEARWRHRTSGKPGGLRVLYFVRHRPNEFWMLALYAKAKQENAPGHILKKLKEAFGK